MKQEELFEIIGQADEAYVVQAGKKRTKKKYRWLKWSALAACIAVVAVFAYVRLDFRLLMWFSFGGDVDTAAHETQIPLEGRIAIYEEVALRRGDLENYTGEMYLQNGESLWYYPEGSDSLQYLIRVTKGEAPTLWIFRSFRVVQDMNSQEDAAWYQEHYPKADFSPYTYGDVYRIIYGVESADDIASITARPSTANNTDLGKEIQRQVGTRTHRDREDIEAFYQVTKDVLCLGSSDWRDYSAAAERFTYSFSTDAEDKLTSGEETWGCRYLTVTLKDGSRIDSWKYNALKGCFYEFGGIGTKPLEETAVQALNAILGIQ